MGLLDIWAIVHDVNQYHGLMRGNERQKILNRTTHWMNSFIHSFTHTFVYTAIIHRGP